MRHGSCARKDIKTDCSVNTTFNGKILLLRQRDGQGRLPQAPGGISHQRAGVLLKQEPIADYAMNASDIMAADPTLSGGGNPLGQGERFSYHIQPLVEMWRKGRPKWRVEVPSV